MSKKAKPPHRLPCPTCRAPVRRDHSYFPFCSDRCRLLDLGKWASGAYKVSTPITDPEELRDAANREAAGKKSGNDARK